jgi:hypothetical protein
MNVIAATFGTEVPGRNYDPDLMTGWGKRSFNWEFTTSVQQELLPRVSLDVQYARRWYGNIRVMDDKAVTPADYTTFSIPVPSDLGGGTLTGITVRPDAPASSYFITLSDNYGKMTEHFDGVNISVNARLQNGLVLQGGTGSGRQKLNDCEIVDDLPEMGHTFFGDPTRAFFFAARPKEFCETNNGWRTRSGALHPPEDRRRSARRGRTCRALRADERTTVFPRQPGPSSRSRRSRFRRLVTCTSSG